MLFDTPSFFIGSAFFLAKNLPFFVQIWLQWRYPIIILHSSNFSFHIPSFSRPDQYHIEVSTRSVVVRCLTQEQ